MMIGLPIPHALLPALAVLTALGGITVLQRGWTALVRILAVAGPRPSRRG